MSSHWSSVATRSLARSTEHIENAGVHSGDSHIVLPAQKLNKKTKKEVEDHIKKIFS